VRFPNRILRESSTQTKTVIMDSRRDMVPLLGWVLLIVPIKVAGTMFFLQPPKLAHGVSYGFHPIHSLLALHPLKRLRHAGKVFVAGIEEPELAHHLSFEPTATVEEALRRAEELHGPEASIACVRYPMGYNRQ
jgi:hypothetical protein